MMVVIAIIDLRRRKIYNIEIAILLMIWMLWVSFHIVTLGNQGISFTDALIRSDSVMDISVIDGLIAACVFGTGSLILTLLFERATGRFAMGGGDIKLLFAVGLFLGVEGEAIALLIACALFAAIGMILRRRMRDTLPFGPFIAIGSILVLLA